MAKTIEEMIAVMQGYKDGKKIEVTKVNRDEWVDDYAPFWDWINFDYRIAEEPKYRPYKDTEEMINDFCNRFNVTRTKFSEPFIWIKLKINATSKHLITDIYDFDLWLCNDKISINTMFEHYTYLDGSPCGVKE